MEAENGYGDSDFLAHRDITVRDFRESEKESKRDIMEKMLTLRHNMKYNKHLQSVYMKAKELFDKMVEEHRSQLYYLDEIYRHLNSLIRENLSKHGNGTSAMMVELVKDKKRIGKLLKKMRRSFDKLMDIDTVVGVTIDKINEITFMEDDVESDDDTEEEDEGGESHATTDEDEDSEEGEEDEEEEGDEDGESHATTDEDEGEEGDEESHATTDEDEDDEDDDEYIEGDEDDDEYIEGDEESHATTDEGDGVEESHATTDESDDDELKEIDLF